MEAATQREHSERYEVNSCKADHWPNTSTCQDLVITVSPDLAWLIQWLRTEQFPVSLDTLTRALSFECPLQNSD